MHSVYLSLPLPCMQLVSCLKERGYDDGKGWLTRFVGSRSEDVSVLVHSIKHIESKAKACDE